MLYMVINELIVVDRKNKSVQDEQAQTQRVITVL